MLLDTVWPYYQLKSTKEKTKSWYVVRHNESSSPSPCVWEFKI